MATTSQKTPELQVLAQGIVKLLTQGLPTGIAAVPVNGTAYKAQGLIAVIQPIDDEFTKVAGQATDYHDSVAELHGSLPAYRALLYSTRKVLKEVYAGNTAALALIGSQPKSKVRKTVAEKAASVAKAAETKQKKSGTKVKQGASGAAAASVAPVATTGAVAGS